MAKKYEFDIKKYEEIYDALFADIGKGYYAALKKFADKARIALIAKRQIYEHHNAERGQFSDNVKWVDVKNRKDFNTFKSQIKELNTIDGKKLIRSTIHGSKAEKVFENIEKVNARGQTDTALVSTKLKQDKKDFFSRTDADKQNHLNKEKKFLSIQKEITKEKNKQQKSDESLVEKASRKHEKDLLRAKIISAKDIEIADREYGKDNTLTAIGIPAGKIATIAIIIKVLNKLYGVVKGGFERASAYFNSRYLDKAYSIDALSSAKFEELKTKTGDAVDLSLFAHNLFSSFGRPDAINKDELSSLARIGISNELVKFSIGERTRDDVINAFIQARNKSKDKRLFNSLAGDTIFSNLNKSLSYLENLYPDKNINTLKDIYKLYNISDVDALAKIYKGTTTERIKTFGRTKKEEFYKLFDNDFLSKSPNEIIKILEDANIPLSNEDAKNAIITSALAHGGILELNKKGRNWRNIPQTEFFKKLDRAQKGFRQAYPYRNFYKHEKGLLQFVKQNRNSSEIKEIENKLNINNVITFTNDGNNRYVIDVKPQLTNNSSKH